MRVLALLVLVVTCVACGSSDDDPPSFGTFDCDPGDSRCSGDTIQICNADERWESFRVCSAVGEECTTDTRRCGGFTGPCCD